MPMNHRSQEPKVSIRACIYKTIFKLSNATQLMDHHCHTPAVLAQNDGMDEVPDEYVNPEHFGYRPEALKWDASAKPPDGAMKAYPA